MYCDMYWFTFTELFHTGYPMKSSLLLSPLYRCIEISLNTDQSDLRLWQNKLYCHVTMTRWWYINAMSISVIKQQLLMLSRIWSCERQSVEKVLPCFMYFCRVNELFVKNCLYGISFIRCSLIIPIQCVLTIAFDIHLWPPNMRYAFLQFNERFITMTKCWESCVVNNMLLLTYDLKTVCLRCSSAACILLKQFYFKSNFHQLLRGKSETTNNVFLRLRVASASTKSVLITVYMSD